MIYEEKSHVITSPHESGSTIKESAGVESITLTFMPFESFNVKGLKVLRKQIHKFFEKNQPKK